MRHYVVVYGPRQPSEGASAIVTGVFLKLHELGQDLTIEVRGCTSCVQT